MSPAARLLLLSNSTASGFPYLQLWAKTIMSFLGLTVKHVLFVPFAGVTLDWDEYTSRVQTALPELTVTGIHRVPDMAAAVAAADVLMVGGGNTFHLLSHLHQHNLSEAMSERVLAGVPYIGWSAGSNVAAPDIGTTNDMPVVWPDRAEALNLIPFNLNPHYSNWKPPGYQGEGRDDRLNEAILVKKRTIVALSEGVGLRAENQSVTVIKSGPEQRPPESRLEVRIWKPLPTAPFFHVVDVPTDQPDQEFLLDPFLIGP